MNRPNPRPNPIVVTEDSVDIDSVGPLSPGQAGATLTADDILTYETNRARARAAPLTFHQAATYFCFDKDTSLQDKMLWVAGSFLLVLVQVYVLIALITSTYAPSCSGNWQCTHGRICMDVANVNVSGTLAIAKENLVRKGSECTTCGSRSTRELLRAYVPRTSDGDCPLTANWSSVCPLDTNFTCPEGDDVCQGCYDPVHHSFKTHSGEDLMRDVFSAMNVRDFSAVLLCAFVISISVSRAIKNNWMCDLQRTKGLAEKKL